MNIVKDEIIRLWKAWHYSRDGLVAAFRQDRPFTLEVILSVFIIPLGLYAGVTGVERALLVGSWLMVPAFELLNCGLEAITDYATKAERHDLAKKTKDVGSAAVFVAIVNFLLTWYLIIV
jgi:diacylglycerol kinase (ATP)